MNQDGNIVEKKKKVILIENTIPEYRLPIYNTLNELFDLQVIYSYGKIPDGIDFKVIKIPIFRIGKLCIHRGNLVNYVKDSDIVIGMFSLPWLSIMFLPFLRLKQKIIFWGMGVSGSLSNKYDYSNKYLKTYLKLLKKVDAAIFYSEYPKIKYKSLGIIPEKMYIAYNTVQVEKIIINDSNKNFLIFIGSLYKAKKVDELIIEYQIASQNSNDIPVLLIIGSGEEELSLKHLVDNYGLSSKILFLGPIFEEKELASLFSQAILCISPGQAGLSVQKSMGYGVPFATVRDAFTGGEVFDIKDGQNGILLDNNSKINALLTDVAENKEKYLIMGRNAYNYYWSNRTPNHMVQGFLDAIQYVLK